MKKLSKVTIIGVGLIGGSIGLSLRQKNLCDHICGIDEYSIIHRALERGILTEGCGYTDLASSVEDAEIVFICTPIQQIFEIIPRLSKAVGPNTIVCDVGSTKAHIVQFAASYFNQQNAYFIGTHPMAGSEFRGLDAADYYLFENAVWVLTPDQKMPDEYIRKIGTLLEKLGAKVLFLSPEQHDHIAAAVSHLPQMLAVTLTNLIARFNQENPNYLRLAAGGFRDMTRIASSPFSIWKDILQHNQEPLLFFIDEFIKDLKQVKENLLTSQVEDDFEKANVTRLAIPKDTKGFLKPTYDISIGVEDKPGVIARLASLLAEQQINIKDIEILKVREGEGGIIRMAFANEKDRTTAMELIKHAGFSCQKRD